MFSEHSIPVGGLRLNVAEGPRAGPPVWFFHGLGRRWQDFAPLLGSLAGLWHVRAVDHRGHGRSSHAPGCYSVADYISDAATLVGNSRDPAVIVGHSLGALTALGVAARVPEAVRAVVLLDPPGPEFLENIDATLYAVTWTAMKQLAGKHHSVSHLTRELAELRLPGPAPGGTVRFGDLRDAASLRFMAKCLHDLDPDTLTLPLAKKWLDGFDPLAAAAAVRSPALLVIGDPKCGGMLPPPESDSLAAALRDCSRVDLTGIGHLIHWQDAQTTLRLLHTFLGSLP